MWGGGDGDQRALGTGSSPCCVHLRTCGLQGATALFILTILLHSSSRTAPKTPARVCPRAVGTHSAPQTPQGEYLAPTPLLALVPGVRLQTTKNGETTKL